MDSQYDYIFKCFRKKIECDESSGEESSMESDPGQRSTDNGLKRLVRRLFTLWKSFVITSICLAVTN